MWDSFSSRTVIGYNIAGREFINHPGSGIAGAIAGRVDCTNVAAGSPYTNILYSFTNNGLSGKCHQFEVLTSSMLV